MQTAFSNSCTDRYRFTFNGKETDNELKGINNSLNFGARIYDPRLGKWFGLDPEAGRYADLSPYCFVANSTLIAIDPSGETIVIVGSQRERNKMKAELQKLTDQKVKLKADGTVKLKKRWFAKSTKSFGTELVRELVNDPHVVSISATTGITKTTPENADAAYTGGNSDAGSSSNIEVNFDENVSVLNEIYDQEVQPDQITLGRELLYAKDFANGDAIPGMANEGRGVYLDPDQGVGPFQFPISAQEYRVRTNGEQSLRNEQNMLQRLSPPKSELREVPPIEHTMPEIDNPDIELDVPERKK